MIKIFSVILLVNKERKETRGINEHLKTISEILLFRLSITKTQPHALHLN